MIQAYEIQTYKGGVWQVDSVFDDKELAVHEATTLHERGRYVGVRVVLETYNEETDEVTVRTVLKLSNTDAEDAVARGRQAETDKEIRKGKKRVTEVRKTKRDAITTKRKKKKALKSRIGLSVQLIIVVVVGFALLFVMRMAYKFI